MSLEYTLSEFFIFGLFTFGGIGFCVWKRRQKRLSRFIDLTIDGIVLSSNGVIVEVNQQAISIFGSFSKYQLLGKNVLDFVAPQSKELVKEKLAMRRVDRYECTLLKSDGTPFPALIRGTNISHKKHLRLSAIVDLSELKKTTQALEVLNQTLAQKVEEHIAKNRQQEMVLFQQARHAQMSEMISMIAHQWRQPLNVLSLMSQNIVFKYKMNMLDDTLMNTFKQDSMKQILQMSKTIDDFRNFFKPDKTKKMFDVKKQLLYVAEMLKDVYATHHIELIIKADDGLKLESFPNEFNQCIINLLNNAKDVLVNTSIKNEKFIVISAFKNEEGKVVIIVEDSGDGIDESVLPHLFEPYFSTKESGVGTGLGLYMTKMIIETHMQGSIRVSNAQSGARFEIIL